MNTRNKTDSKVVIFVLGTASILVSVLSFSPARALTGSDVLDKMSSEASDGYLFGSMEMAAFLSHIQGNAERSRCISKWYSKDGGVKQVIQALDRFKDREAMPVLYALIQKACGK